MSRSVPPDVVVDYPCSDDQPMAESEFQLVPMLYVLTVLRTHFRRRERQNVYVGGDMFVYYEEGNPGAVVAPDVFVVIGAPKRTEHPRDTYKLWEEPKGPDFVLEVLSSSTWETDLGPKRALYASLGVAEYWLFVGGDMFVYYEEGNPGAVVPRTYSSSSGRRNEQSILATRTSSGRSRRDPTREHLSPPLRGLRLVGREYRELPVLQLAASAPTFRSDVLGLDLRLDRGALRFRDAATGEDLLSHEEAVAARQQEAAARRAAEAQIADLQAKLRDL